MSSWLLALLASSQVPYELLALIEIGENPSPKSQGISMNIIPSDSVYQRTPVYRFQIPICKNMEFFFFS